jgi:hypothetical protein
MNEPFNIPVLYEGEEREYKARFERWGYTHRIAVLIGESTVVFEPDEEGGYRAISVTNSGVIPVGLLQVLAEKITNLTRQ